MNVEKKPVRKIDDVTVTWANIVEESQDKLISKFQFVRHQNISIDLKTFIMKFLSFHSDINSC